MERHDPFDEMDRMFEQLRTSMFSAMDAGRTDRHVDVSDRRMETSGDRMDASRGRTNALDRRMDAANRRSALDARKSNDTAGRGREEMAPERNHEEMAPERRSIDTFGREGINMDLKRHDDEYVFVADLPGFETEEIDLTFEDGTLVLTAESRLSDETTDGETMREESTDEKTASATDERSVRREFVQSRRVARRVTIPEPVVEADLTASYRNGVLEVHLPLVATEADEDGKRIDIEN